MIRRPLALIACALTLAAGIAQAAQAGVSLAGVKGEVLVSGGSGFTQATSGAALKAGDRVVARGGEASVRYADGCVSVLKPGVMATIAAKSPCAGGPGLVQAASGSPAQFLKKPNWPVGAYFAGAGVVVIVGAIVYGVSGAISD